CRGSEKTDEQQANRTATQKRHGGTRFGGGGRVGQSLPEPPPTFPRAMQGERGGVSLPVSGDTGRLTPLRSPENVDARGAQAPRAFAAPYLLVPGFEGLPGAGAGVAGGRLLFVVPGAGAGAVDRFRLSVVPGVRI